MGSKAVLCSEGGSGGLETLEQKVASLNMPGDCLSNNLEAGQPQWYSPARYVTQTFSEGE